ncbi:hypothetical protein [Amycolatopsis sp. NPDC051372]|uniref:hypothetical protein n=1 Tax=unclassified Amycolatopsis TaxID=2618356 RepID=UPI0034156CE2
MDVFDEERAARVECQDEQRERDSPTGSLYGVRRAELVRGGQSGADRRHGQHHTEERFARNATTISGTSAHANAPR